MLDMLFFRETEGETIRFFCCLFPCEGISLQWKYTLQNTRWTQLCSGIWWGKLSNTIMLSNPSLIPIYHTLWISKFLAASWTDMSKLSANFVLPVGLRITSCFGLSQCTCSTSAGKHVLIESFIYYLESDLLGSPSPDGGLKKFIALFSFPPFCPHNHPVK